MTIKFHPQTNQPPKVYDVQQHQDYANWCLKYLHRKPSKLEMKVTRENFTYDLEYYLSLPNPSNNIEIQ